MKVPLSLLKEYIDLSIPSSQIADVLTSAGIEVDGIDLVGSSFSGVVVAEVRSSSRHPTADRLSVAQVFDGQEEFQVVCGAPNCRAGIKVAFARVGAKLMGSDGKEFAIKKAKLRDVESFGMLCSSDELQLGESGGKIMELGESAPLGTDLKVLYSDEIFSLSLTPNLGHCLSILGIARELSAHLDLPLRKRDFSFAGTGSEKGCKVEVIDRKQCNRYAFKIVRNVQVGASPDWLKKKIEACGLRSINNVVDVGNLVMIELGQPLHLFDCDLIAGKKLLVTSHTDYTHLTTLDGQERLIPPEALLICDEEKPLAFAGLMGGLSSAVTENTKNILIESANFSPTSIRKTSRVLQLKTDASSRFEKGVDIAIVPDALAYAAELLTLVAKGDSSMGIEDLQIHPMKRKKIDLRTQRVNQLLGVQLAASEIGSLLTRLQMKILEESPAHLVIEVPSFRLDIQEEIDLVEEVARVYGYQQIPHRAPRQIVSALLHSPLYEMESLARRYLQCQGLQEWMTCDLISPRQSELSLMHGMTEKNKIAVLHSASLDQSVLRTTLLPGLVQVAKYNIDRGCADLAGFEVGRIHFAEGNDYLEPTVAGFLLSGKSTPYHFDPKPREVDFFDLKGIVESFLSNFSFSHPRFEISHFAQFHPGRQAKLLIGDVFIGVLGEIHPSYLEGEGIDKRALFAQINLNELLALYKPNESIVPIVPFPGSERDWTLTVPIELPLSVLLDAVKKAESCRLEKFFLLDLYKSSQIGEDKKNVTLRFLYRDKEKTLSFEEVEKEHAHVMGSVLERMKVLL